MSASTKHSGQSQCEFFRPSTIFVIGAMLFVMTAALHGGNIFDDDYMPPKRVEPAPEQPAPAPPQTSPTPPPVVGPNPTPVVPAPGPAHEADTAIHRALPDRATRTKTRKLFEEVFATELKDHTPAARRKLAQKLIEEAGKTMDGSPDQFVLLIGAIQAAEEGQSLRMAFTAARQLAKEFGVDELAMKAEAATKAFAGSGSTALSSCANVQLLLDLANQLLAEDAVATLAPIESLLQRAAPGISDPEIKTQVKDQIREVGTYREASQKVAPMIAKLKQSPNDPAANLAVGKCFCFQRGQWTRGLPLLAKSNETPLKDLALAELAQPTDGDEIVKLADAWVAASSRFPPPDRAKTLEHAGELYRRAEASATGLQKLSIEKKLAQIPASTRPRHVDLLDLFNPATCVVKGSWRMQDDSLVCESDPNARICFPYQPPEEYDFKVSFTVVKHKDAISQICYCGGHQFMFLLGGSANTIAAFELIDGVLAKSNKTANKKDQWLTDGQHYSTVVKLRKTGAEAYVNGQLVSRLQNDYSRMTIGFWFALPHKDALGIAADSDIASFDAIEVTEITGEGKMLAGK